MAEGASLVCAWLSNFFYILIRIDLKRIRLFLRLKALLKILIVMILENESFLRMIGYITEKREWPISNQGVKVICGLDKCKFFMIFLLRKSMPTLIVLPL